MFHSPIPVRNRAVEISFEGRSLLVSACRLDLPKNRPFFTSVAWILDNKTRVNCGFCKICSHPPDAQPALSLMSLGFLPGINNLREQSKRQPPPLSFHGCISSTRISASNPHKTRANRANPTISPNIPPTPPTLISFLYLHVPHDTTVLHFAQDDRVFRGGVFN